MQFSERISCSQVPTPQITSQSRKELHTFKEEMESLFKNLRSLITLKGIGNLKESVSEILRIDVSLQTDIEVINIETGTTGEK